MKMSEKMRCRTMTEMEKENNHTIMWCLAKPWVERGKVRTRHGTPIMEILVKTIRSSIGETIESGLGTDDGTINTALDKGYRLLRVKISPEDDCIPIIGSGDL